MVEQLFALALDFTDRPRPQIAGSRKQQIRNSIGLTSVACIRRNPQSLGQRHRAFPQGSDIGKDREG